MPTLDTQDLPQVDRLRRAVGLRKEIVVGQSQRQLVGAVFRGLVIAVVRQWSSPDLETADCPSELPCRELSLLPARVFPTRNTKQTSSEGTKGLLLRRTKSPRLLCMFLEEDKIAFSFIPLQTMRNYFFSA